MNTWNIITGIATLIGLAIAYYQFNEKKKLERFTKSSLQGIAGNLAKIQQSTEWADSNFRATQSEAVKLPDSDIKRKITLYVHNGQGDVVASDRMVVNLFNDILTLQEGQFGTRIINHPDGTDLALIKKETERNKSTKVNTAIS